jgi:DNA polymerase III subunit delta
MIILIQGKDSYLKKEKIKSLTSDKDAIVYFFDTDNLDVRNILDKIKQETLFNQKKIIIISNLIEKLGTEEAKNIIKKSLPYEERVIVFVEEKRILEKSSLKKNISKVYECNPLKDSDMISKWVLDRFDSKKATITKDGLKKIVDFLGNDLWLLSNEIEKLCSYKKEISADDIDLLVKPIIENNIFKTIDAIADKNRRQAIDLIYSSIEKGDSIIYLLSMIGFQFRNLLIAKSANSYSNPKEFNMHPYVFKKALIQSRRFSELELKNFHQNILQTDINIKTGKTEPKTALDLLLFKI